MLLIYDCNENGYFHLFILILFILKNGILKSTTFIFGGDLEISLFYVNKVPKFNKLIGHISTIHVQYYFKYN